MSNLHIVCYSSTSTSSSSCSQLGQHTYVTERKEGRKKNTVGLKSRKSLKDLFLTFEPKFSWEQSGPAKLVESSAVQISRLSHLGPAFVHPFPKLLSVSKHFQQMPMESQPKEVALTSPVAFLKVAS
jgi:hypothetical protein